MITRRTILKGLLALPFVGLIGFNVYKKFGKHSMFLDAFHQDFWYMLEEAVSRNPSKDTIDYKKINKMLDMRNNSIKGEL